MLHQISLRALTSLRIEAFEERELRRDVAGSCISSCPIGYTRRTLIQHGRRSAKSNLSASSMLVAFLPLNCYSCGHFLTNAHSQLQRLLLFRDAPSVCCALRAFSCWSRMYSSNRPSARSLAAPRGYFKDIHLHRYVTGAFKVATSDRETLATDLTNTRIVKCWILFFHGFPHWQYFGHQ